MRVLLNLLCVCLRTLLVVLVSDFLFTKQFVCSTVENRWRWGWWRGVQGVCVILAWNKHDDAKIADSIHW